MKYILVVLASAGFFKSERLVQGIKIAFVGDTGMDDSEYNGYGHLTMKMIDDERVDLVVDVGDYDYWGRCTEEYEVENTLSIDSMLGGNIQVPDESTLKRFKWQDGRHGYVRGWEIGIQSSWNDPTISSTKELSIITDLFERHVISDKSWEEIKYNLKLRSGERECYSEPWDGPSAWNQFLREHNFDFLGASGNAEVKEAPAYGSAEIWAAHQRYLHELYMERIYNTNRGACHGYENQKEPGTVEEYGERYSCFYNNSEGYENFHFIFLGWWQGSNEGTGNDAKEQRRKSIDFINREFKDERSQIVPWRFCVHHMTSAKLSAGDKRRNSMILSGITDMCRKHGALIISGHHHLYSRTKLLQSVGGPKGDEDVLAVGDTDNDASQYVLGEGLTVSLTVGMGGYDGSCNGLYNNATWMEKCISRPSDHRGAVIAEFNEENPLVGTFQYMNSMEDGKVVDEFQITSTFPTNAPTSAPTNAPTDAPSISPSASPNAPPAASPSASPTESSQPSPPNLTRRPTPKPTSKPTREPTRKPISKPGKPPNKPSRKPSNKPTRKPTRRKPSRKPEEKEVCISIHQIICSDDRFSTFCDLINKYDLVDYFLSNSFSLTVFAPTSKAFKSMKDNGLLDFDELTRKQSQYVLLYHVVDVVAEETVHTYSNLECGGLLKTANGESSRTKCYENDKFQRGPMQNDYMLPKIATVDVDACNGIIHAIDQVILPNLGKVTSSFLS